MRMGMGCMGMGCMSVRRMLHLPGSPPALCLRGTP
jgi:hypothetical protein